METIWKAAAGVLSTVAPMLATAVGGPLAGAATNAIIGALGLPQDTPPEQVAQAVQNATPDQLLAIKKAEGEFAVQMKALDVTLEQLRYSDTANARAREVAVRDWMPKVLGLLVVGSTIAAVLLVLVGVVRFLGVTLNVVVDHAAVFPLVRDARVRRENDDGLAYFAERPHVDAATEIRAFEEPMTCAHLVSGP